VGKKKEKKTNRAVAHFFGLEKKFEKETKRKSFPKGLPD
jgi:hypothetical protein